MAMKDIRYYAGIGSRETPPEILEIMNRIASYLEACGFVLRSGGADGADTAFESGVQDPHHKEIFIPWDGFNGRQASETGVYTQAREDAELAEKYAANAHPAWYAKRSDGTDVLSRGARRLHMRNVSQVLGFHLQYPIKFAIIWAEESNGNPKGGTGQAVRICQAIGIPIFNLIIERDFNRIMSKVEQYESNRLR